MKSKIFFSLLFLFHLGYATEDYQFWNGNQINNLWDNTGRITLRSVNAGMEWPAGSGNTLVFAAGLWVVAGRVNTAEDIRSAAAEFTTESLPGPWGSDPELPENRIYKIRTADGRSNPDWDIWPIDQGAPWIDVNEDGVYDPAIDSPDVKGDLYFWTVFNDGNADRHSHLWSTPPLDIEVTSAIYGFEGPGALENTMFIEWNIKNAGTNQLDSVFLGIWQDIDLGDATNDYPGCAPELDLSYHYVGELPDEDYGMFPPAVGFSLLQGPIVPSIGDTAWVSGELVPDYKNLHTSAFIPFCAVDCPDPEIAGEAYLAMQGRNQEGNLYVNPSNNTPEPFMYSGNPVDGSGWLAVNDTYPRDWRGVLSTGSISLAPGASQQLVAACVVSPGMGPIAALAALFDDVETVRDVYNSQFTEIESMVQVSEIDIPHNTESSGPFTFQFEILDSQNRWSGSKYINFITEVGLATYVLESVGDNVYQAEIPESFAMGTVTAFYYIFHDDGVSDLDYWPSGAPRNARLFTFGPDQEGPVIAGLQEHHNVHYLLPFTKSVQIDTVYDQRFDVEDIWLNWTIGGSDIMTAPMVSIDSNEVDWRLNQVYLGELADVVSQEGDTVKYWVTALDGSLGNNAGNSEIHSFVAQNHEIVADFDRIGNLFEIVDWQPFENAILSEFINGADNWLHVILLAVNASDVTADTMQMIRELDLTPFDAAWFNIPMVASFRDSTNYGLIQIQADGVYHTVDSLYGTIPPATYSYDLSPFLDATDVSIRFVANPNFGFMRWMIDDVIFHTDPTLVGIKDVALTPGTFSLKQNYPNPFNPSTRIEYSLPEPLDVKFSIYDLMGRNVFTFKFEDQEAGNHEIRWDGHNEVGQLAATGVYFGRFEAGEFQTTIKMVLLR